ncbi:MAG: hypothetical protein WCB31_08255 [Nitrososphaeraceae archaeon]
MGNFTDKENQILMPLVADCVNYGYSEKEALSYIKARLGREISTHAYYVRKKLVDSGHYAKEWLNYFTRVGFVVKHKQIIEIIEMLQKDSIRDYLIEQAKPHGQKDIDLIQKLRYEIRENCKIMQELSLGTPIIAQIKAKLEHAESISERQ